LPADAKGDSIFNLLYTTPPLKVPLGIAELRRDRVLKDASFLKAGAAGTLFQVSRAQADRLLALLHGRNKDARHIEWPKMKADPGPTRPRALSLRQPWAELVMRGEKTIEARSRQTHVRGRVHIYASLGRLELEEETRVEREYDLDIEGLPRGVLVGTVEIVGCRPLARPDSRDAAFPVPAGSTDFAWLLARPERAVRLVKPKLHPQPVFFTPF
jgi:hypothetical protein